jgi:phosphate transport system ATP-binding protein
MKVTTHVEQSAGPPTSASDVDAAAAGDASVAPAAVELQGLSASFGGRVVVEDVSFAIRRNSVTAIIGPSGSGKSTIVRCINRMHEVVPGAGHTGTVLVEGLDIHGPGIDPVDVRRRVGMVFQRPNPFPTMSIYDNVAAGLRLNRVRLSRSDLDAIVQESLEGAGLWKEVRDRLGGAAANLSGGQQQRLCIARAIALRPQVLLMDEPASALDPQSTLRIEDLIGRLKESYTIVIVTHNMQQAARVADDTAFLTVLEEGQPSRLVEFDRTDVIFTHPTHQKTQDYVTGRFG